MSNNFYIEFFRLCFGHSPCTLNYGSHCIDLCHCLCHYSGNSSCWHNGMVPFGLYFITDTWVCLVYCFSGAVYDQYTEVLRHPDPYHCNTSLVACRPGAQPNIDTLHTIESGPVNPSPWCVQCSCSARRTIVLVCMLCSRLVSGLNGCLDILLLTLGLIGLSGWLWLCRCRRVYQAQS